MRHAFEDCVLDVDRRELMRGGKPVAIEPQVFDLLTYLVQQRDRVVSKDDLITAVWGGRIVSESTLTSRINAARQAIGDSGKDQRLIRTYARKGFRFTCEVQEARDAEQVRSDHQHAGVSRDDLADPSAAGLTAACLSAEFHGKPTVAVLPFNNMSGDPEQEYLSDGITEDIITALARHRSLLVIARNSTFAFKGHGTDVRRVGTDLGADYIVEGSVRRMGPRIRITAQLVEAEGGRHLWAERYDRILEDIFEVQDEIVATIAARIEPEVGNFERVRVERKSPEALHAWDYYHLGLKHFYRPTAQDNAEAQQLFRRAIALDPDLAQAYASLSYAIVLGMVYFDAHPDSERLDEAIKIARRAVELDDQDASIRFIYGRALLARRAYRDAIAELETALELNPNLAVVYCGLGDSLAYEGRFGEAIPHFQRAIELSPHDPQRWAFYSYRALAHLLACDFEQADEWAEKATRVPNSHYWPFAHRVSALGHLQQSGELAVALQELLRRKPEFSSSFARQRLFFVKDPAHLDVYLEGLRKAGVPD